MANNIKNHSKLVVQTNDTVNSIRFDVIKNSIAPLAKPPLAGVRPTPVPGMMYPGTSMIYDEATGELNVGKNAVREYKGMIGYGAGTPYDGGQTPSMMGDEPPGSFYIVADFNYRYTQNDWGTLGSDAVNNVQRVYLGDIDERNEKSDWDLIPMQIGNQHVHNEFYKYPHISKVTADAIIGGDPPGTTDTVVGTVIQATGYTS